MLSCGRVKTELFENVDVTVSICNPSERALGSLGITRGHFVYLFSDFECHSVFVWTGIISKTPLVWTRIFYHTDTKDASSKVSGLDTCGRGLSTKAVSPKGYAELPSTP